jgi:hypothetical protein
VIDLIDSGELRFVEEVGLDEVESFFVEQVSDVRVLTGAEAVEAVHLVTIREETLTEVAPDEAAAAGHED